MKNIRKSINVCVATFVLFSFFSTIFLIVNNVFSVKKLTYISIFGLLCLPLIYVILILTSFFIASTINLYTKYVFKLSKLKYSINKIFNFFSKNSLLYFLVSLFVSVVEDFSFRYFLIEIFTLFNFTLVGIFIQAIFFGVAHYPNLEKKSESTIYAFVAAVYGIIFGFVYYFFGYFIVVMSHCLYDFTIFLIEDTKIMW